VDLFSDDAIAILPKHGRFQGKEAIREEFKQVVKTNRGEERNSHVAVQPIIHVNGDKATAQWLMYILAVDPKGEYENIFQHGRHDVEYVRINGQWKIKYLIFTTPWPREARSKPTLEQLAEWAKENKR
jgi:ketosteroid isomerase-like protein